MVPYSQFSYYERALTFGSVAPQSPPSSAQSWVVVVPVMFQSWSPVGAVNPVPVVPAGATGGTLGVTREAVMGVAPHYGGKDHSATVDAMLYIHMYYVYTVL